MFGEKLKNIRRTEKVKLLLELDKTAHQISVCFRKSIDEALCSVEEVRAISDEVLIVIKGYREDVYRAILRLGAALASILLGARKVRIGWVFCRVRQNIAVPRRWSHCCRM